MSTLAQSRELLPLVRDIDVISADDVSGEAVTVWCIVECSEVISDVITVEYVEYVTCVVPDNDIFAALHRNVQFLGLGALVRSDERERTGIFSAVDYVTRQCARIVIGSAEKAADAGLALAVTRINCYP